MSSILTMYPWHLAIAKTEFYTGEHTTFYMLAGAMLLRGPLHFLLQLGQTSVQNPELQGRDLVSHLTQLPHLTFLETSPKEMTEPAQGASVTYAS